MGFIPAGLQHLSDTWHAVIPDYSLPGLNGSFGQSAVVYILAAVIGVAFLVGITYLFGRVQQRTTR